MKFCYNTNFTLPKQSQRYRSVLQDTSQRITVSQVLLSVLSCFTERLKFKVQYNLS